MPTTLVHKIAYPLGTVAPNIPVLLQTQAESTDAAITAAVKRRYAEFTGPTIDSNPGAGNNTGLLVADASKTFNNDFCRPYTTGSFGVEILVDGVYSFQGFCNYQQNPGNVNVSTYITGTGGAGIVDSHSQGTYGDWQTSTGCPAMFLAAGQRIEFIQANSGGVFLNFKVKVFQLASL